MGSKHPTQYMPCDRKECGHSRGKHCVCGNHSSKDGKKSYRGRQWQKRYTNKGGRREKP